MRILLRTWRLLILSWAVLLAPQMAFVHLLSHALPQAEVQGEKSDAHAVAAKVCSTCCAFAQHGTALPSGCAATQDPPEPIAAPDASVPSVDARRLDAFQARGPPSLPT